MSRLLKWVAILLPIALAMVFASLNGGQRVTLNLGFVAFYGVSLTVIAFVSLLAGMLVMLISGIQSDLKVRDILRARLEAEDLEERNRFVDRDQQDMSVEGEE